MRRTLALAGAAVLAIGLTGLAGPASADSGGGIALVTDVHLNELGIELDGSLAANGVEGEFLEIVNDSTGTISVAGWKVLGCDTAGSFEIVTFPSGTSLAAGEKLLVGSDDYAGGPTRDFEFGLNVNLVQAGGAARLVDDTSSLQAPDIRWGNSHPNCSTFTPAGVSPNDTESMNLRVSDETWFLDEPTPENS